MTYIPPENHLLSNRISHLQMDVDAMYKDAKRLRREAGVFMRRVKKDISAMAKENKEHRAFLEEIISVNKCVEETLCKVLLAIRQNEYLQAWYPEEKK